MNTPLAWQGRSELSLLQDFLNKDNRSNCYSNKHLKGQSELWLAGSQPGAEVPKHSQQGCSPGSRSLTWRSGLHAGLLTITLHPDQEPRDWIRNHCMQMCFAFTSSPVSGTCWIRD